MNYSKDFISLPLINGGTIDVAKRKIIAIQENGSGAIVILDAKNDIGNNIIIETKTSTHTIKMILLQTPPNKEE
jgi:hypothetical protein